MLFWIWTFVFLKLGSRNQVPLSRSFITKSRREYLDILKEKKRLSLVVVLQYHWAFLHVVASWFISREANRTVSKLMFGHEVNNYVASFESVHLWLCLPQVLEAARLGNCYRNIVTVNIHDKCTLTYKIWRLVPR